MNIFYTESQLLNNSFNRINPIKLLLKELPNILKYQLSYKLYIETGNIIYIFNKIKFKLYLNKKVSNSSIQNISINNNIRGLLILPLVTYKLHKLLYNEIFLGELPLPFNNNIFLLNNINRVFIPKLIKNFSYYNLNKYKLKINLTRFSQIIIIIPNNTIHIKNITVQLLYKSIDSFLIKKQVINIFQFLRIFGISIKELILKSNYSKYIINNILYNNKNFEKKISYIDLLNNRYNEFISKDFNFNILIKNSQIFNSFIHLNFNNNLFKKDFIILLFDVFLHNLLLNVKLNNRDNINNKNIYSWRDFYISLMKHTSAQTFLLNDTNNIENILKELNVKFIDKLYEIFYINPLVQYLDETNLLSKFIHSHKISIHTFSTRPSIISRDINTSFYNKLCPLYTVEGSNVGTIGQPSANLIKHSLTGLNSLLYIQNYNNKEDSVYVNNIILEKNNIIINSIINRRSELFNYDFNIVKNREGFGVTSIQKFHNFYVKDNTSFLSSQINLIPFFFNSDPARCLMGINMQKQALVLLKNQASIVSTGSEKSLGLFIGDNIYSLTEGIVIYISSTLIKIKDIYNRVLDYYFIPRLSNQGAYIYYNIKVWEGERVFSGQILSEGKNTINNELSLGSNLFIAYTSWHGYTYEDALLINDRLIYNRILSTINLKTLKISFDSCYEELTNCFPGNLKINTINLNMFGLSYIGLYLKDKDIIVGKVKKQSINTDILLDNNIFKKVKYNLVKTTNITTNKLNSGILLYINILTSYLNVEEIIYFNIILGQIKSLQIGDKLSGRHGNKGVISAIWPCVDMPFNPQTGIIPDILISPLSIPSRMNIGQLLEGLLGLSGLILDTRWVISLKEENMYNTRYKRNIIYNKLKTASNYTNIDSIYNVYSPGKQFLIDGRNGSILLNNSVIGVSYMFKLVHIIQDKINIRSGGGMYTEIFKQPIKGKSKGGGQRFGEMEVWALEALGAAYELNDILTIKSDTFILRNNYSNSYIDRRNNIMPESWYVLIKHLNSLGLNLYTN
uniref:DNA-directed RNA polymerase subunit beta n=1 Tax=Piridium sociabile TaxID=2570542 RepID=A0A5B9XW42_9ALVE|nr:RNA polymerase subunit beta [Piridium sociabile]